MAPILPLNAFSAPQTEPQSHVPQNLSNSFYGGGASFTENYVLEKLTGAPARKVLKLLQPKVILKNKQRAN